MKTVCIVLNYNDADTTVGLITSISDYKCFDKIIIVDNASTDGSLKQLREIVRDDIILLESSNNGGYGAGNNIGLRYAYEKLKARYALIANPDTSFTEKTVNDLVKIMERQDKLGIIAPVMTKTYEGQEKFEFRSKVNTLKAPLAWPIRTWIYDLLESGPIARRLFSKCLHYDYDYYKAKTCVYVGAVPGSLLLTDIAKILSVGAYDEAVFLYCEENILGYSMKKAGYNTALFLGASYVHKHSVSIDRSYKDMISKQKIREASTLFYYRHYLHINKIQINITKFYYRIINMEIFICEKLLNMKLSEKG